MVKKCCRALEHKGLLAVKPDAKEAEEYIIKAKKNLELCKLYKEKGFDYKLPEEWFYTLYLLRISNFVQIWSRE
ncbi:hypothetical protein J4448_06920 [Candidatus Woesearchaeota archaeon]|nr:hypothetical protein [Candidatus Woesearchaeota archaeon]